MLNRLTKLFQRPAGPAGRPRVGVAVFGKHPSWDDHIEDLGLDSPRLVAVKQILYSQGIAGNIDSARWDRLTEEQRLAGFSHVFLWRFPGECVVGRMWSSQDGKGRAKYPMVVCVHGESVPAWWTADTALPRLAEAEQACKAATTRDAVRAVASRMKQELELRLDGALGPTDEDRDAEACKAVLADAGTHGDQGVLRVAFQIESEFGPLAAPTTRRSSSITDVRARMIRAPKLSGASGPGLGVSARAWSAFVIRAFGADAALRSGLLAIEPADRGFVDLILGEPAPEELVCVRATERLIPRASDVPYSLDEGFISKWRARLAAW